MIDRSASDRQWLREQWQSVWTRVPRTPSHWAEQCRYLDQSVMPGPYRFALTPYLREIVDCLDVDSPVREITVMKGAQVGCTSGVLENAIGYFISEIGSAPVMMVTSDADMAKIRLTQNVIPMINASGLSHLIKSADVKNARKSGKTDQKIEFAGKGFLLPVGAQNPNKFRSSSIQVLLRDEIDSWPRAVGKDGDPLQLTQARTNAYESTRKILDLSTPLIKGDSRIEDRFRRGDRRRYFVRCLKCSFAQTLEWRPKENEQTGELSGMIWEMKDGRLVVDSVRYACENCGHAHTNDDKARLFAPENGARWVPGAEAQTPYHRSYHLSALYSPAGMQSWAALVEAWLAAWDVEHGVSRDNDTLRVFYNTALGETFEERGQKLKFENVSSHRRLAYRLGEVPNAFCKEFCSGPVLLLTCAVDVQKDNLAVAVFGWCRDRRAVLIDYWRFKGDTEQPEDAATWGRLQELIDSKRYTADDGKQYGIEMALVDSGFNTDVVYRFTSAFGGAGVFPTKGGGPSVRDFGELKTPTGIGFTITVDTYKERWYSALRRQWDGLGPQPFGHFNAPVDISDVQLKELTAETKRQKKDSITGRAQGFVWQRTADNELWDLLVYNNAALDIVASHVCKNEFGLPATDWDMFHDWCENQQPYFVAA